MKRKSSGFLLIVSSVVAVFALTLVAPKVFAATYEANYGSACDPGEVKENKCFKTPVSGYSFRVIEKGGVCGDSGILINGFPTNVFDGSGNYQGKLWCYEVVSPNIKTSSSLNQVVLSLPLSAYRDNNPGILNNLEKLVYTGTGFNYSVFDFSEISGCQGDSSATSFAVGDIRGCGIKWTIRLSPTGQPSRFWYRTKKEAEPGVDLAEIVPKIGSGIEPGFILGAAGTSPFTPSNASVCQPIEEKIALKITYDEANCPSQVETCDGTDSSGALNCTECQTTTITNVKATVKDINSNVTIIPKKSLKEIGFLLGDKFCQSGQLIIGSSTCGLVNFAGKYVYRCW